MMMPVWKVDMGKQGERWIFQCMFCLCTQVNTGNSILSELTKAEMSKKVGHFGFSVRYTHENGTCMAV